MCFNYAVDPLLTANIRNSVLRGAADVLEETEEGIFVYDREGEVCFLYAPVDTAKGWLRKHETPDYHLIVLYDDELVAYMAEHYGFETDEKCRQVVWTKACPPENSGVLRIRTAFADDIPLCEKIYRDSHDLQEAILAGNVILGYEGKELVGMIGLHTEGSMGMLEILPPFRRKGYGSELEKLLITRQLEAGRIPFAQVYLSNAASLALQDSIGMEVSKGTLSWMWRD